MSDGLIDIRELPLEMSPDEAVEVAYREDLDWVEEKLRLGLSVLVECDKQLTLYLYRALRKRLRRSDPPQRCALISGHSALEGGGQGGGPQPSLMQGILRELREHVYSGEQGQILVMPHLDVLTTTTKSGLNVETREAIAMVFENPNLVLLGFKDPLFEIPAVMRNVFAAQRELIGIPRDALGRLVVQREARKFAVERFNPFQLYKYVSGLNAVRFREIMGHFADRLDYDDANPETAQELYREIRAMTVASEMELPTVDLEKDIGGYEKVKKQLREDILALLQYKQTLTDQEEILRIEEIVPKGMIFLGPPGTGKTFFAKAMATALNATVSIVSGPELKSKWVGESLPWDEPVLVTINGQARRIPIGELIESHAEDEVMAWTVDDEGRSLLSRVTGFITHDGPDYIDVLTTESGRQVRVTGGHSLFVNDNGRLAEVFAEDVIPGQTRIAVPLRLEAPERLHEIDLLEAFRADEEIHVSGVDAALEAACAVIGLAEADRLAGVSIKRVLQAAQKPPLSVAAMWRVLDAAQVTPPAEGVELYCWHRNKTMPSTLALTPELGEFLGFWVADGCFGQNKSVRLSVHANEEEAIRTRCERLFGHVTRYPKSRLGVDLTLSSTLLYRVMTEVLGMTHGSADKSVPAAIFMAPRETVAAFLRGYFSGDGSFSGKYIEATTTSEALAGDIATLLQYFGIGARLRLKQEPKGRPAHRVRFLWSEYLRTFKEHIGFIQTERQERLSAYLDEMTFKRDAQTPAQHIQGDLLWELVVESRREPYERQHVYDISVPGTERFIAGYGNVLVHNSEENLRRVFSQARRSAPSIIVFDEIDSFATSRGTYTGSGVEHSMVNQLLTEMDGFRKEEMVFVVGTTNFAESLDPALLRPGRFELLIEIPYPNSKDRRAIAELYAKKFKLEFSDEAMDYLIDKTGSFVDERRGVRFSGDHVYAIFRALKREQIRKRGDMTIDEDAINRAISNKKKKKVTFSDEERRTIAIHESGHAMCAHFLRFASSVEKITIATDDSDVLGYVQQTIQENKYITTRNELLDDICVLLGGRVAEQLVIGDISVGAYSDLQKATYIGRSMLEELGMGDTLGLRVVSGRQGIGNVTLRENMAEETAAAVDEELKRLMEEQRARAEHILTSKRDKFDLLVETLLERKTLNKQEVIDLLGPSDKAPSRLEKDKAQKKDDDA